MGRDGEEVLTLDAPISGQVLYNADTRKAYVGNLSATYVADSYPCQTTPLSGMLIYAKDPGCRDLGSNPDRELMVVRPSTGSTGFLFGHEHSCPSGQGSTPELTPVEIEPTALPGTTPDNLYGLYYVRTTSTDSCVPSSYQWYKIAGLPPIDQTKLATTEMAASDLQDLTDGFNMAGWRLVNGKWVAYRITNGSLNVLQSAFGSANYAIRPSYLNPRVLVFDQVSPSFYNQTVAVNLEAQQKYDINATEVQLLVLTESATRSEAYSITLTVDGVEKVVQFVYPASGPGSASFYNFNASHQIMVPIPTSKSISIALVKQVRAAGSAPPSNEARIRVFLEAFK